MRRAFLVLLGVLVSAGLAHADMAYFHFDDPVGDMESTWPIDVVGMDFTFDGGTGDYTILLTADPAHPFQGDFRININVFNPDTGTTAQDPSFFIDAWNDYSGVSPVTTFTLSGTNTRLLSWDIGDRVATSHIVFWPTKPDGISEFRSSVRNPIEGYGYQCDYIAIGDSAVITAVIPAPGAVLLGTLGAGLVGWLRRRRTL